MIQITKYKKQTDNIAFQSIDAYYYSGALMIGASYQSKPD